jgi:hypothetical protein
MPEKSLSLSVTTQPFTSAAEAIIHLERFLAGQQLCLPPSSDVASSTVLPAQVEIGAHQR